MRKAVKLSVIGLVGVAMLALSNLALAQAPRDAGAKVRQEFGTRAVPGRGPGVGAAAAAPGYDAYYRGYYRAPQYRTYYRYAPQRGYYVAPYRGHHHHHHGHFCR